MKKLLLILYIFHSFLGLAKTSLNESPVQVVPVITSIDYTSPYCVNNVPPGAITITGTNLDQVTSIYIGSIAVTDIVSATTSSGSIIINSLPLNAVTAKLYVNHAFGTLESPSVITLLNNPANAGTIYGSSTVCADGTTQYTFYVDPINNATSYNFSLSSGTGVTMTPTGSSAENSRKLIFDSNAPSSVVLSVYGTNGCSNGGTSSVTININKFPETPSAISESGSVGQIVCADNTTQISLSVPTISNATSYEWVYPSGFTVVSGGTGTSIVLLVSSSATNGDIKVRGINSCGAGPYSPVRTMSVNSLPSVTMSNTESICNGQSVTIGPPINNSEYSYSWNSSLGSTNQITVNPTSDTNYILTVTDNISGCSKTFPVTVYVDSTAVSIGAITGATTVCKGSTNVAYATSGADNLTYTWTVPTGASIVSGQGTKNILVNFSTSATTGLISVVANNACGLTSSTESKTITVDTTPNAPTSLNVGGGEFCKGSTATFSVDAVSGATFTWTLPDGITIQSGSGTNQITVLISDVAVSGNVTVGINYTCGVGPLTSAVLSVNNLPTANAGLDKEVCKGSGVQIGTNTAGYTYAWVAFPTGGTISSATAATPTVYPNETTEYTVTVTDSNGCTASDTVKVVVNDIPSATVIANETICFGSSIAIGGTAVSGHSYVWTANGATIATIANPIVTPNSTTTYVLKETNIVTGCENTNQVVITVTPAPIISAGPDASICVGSVYNIGTGGSSYSNVNTTTLTWSKQEASGSFNGDFSIYTPNATDISRGYFILKYSGVGVSPCTSAVEDLVKVNIIDKPTVSITSADAICEGESISLSAVATDYNSIIWNYPGGSALGISYTYVPTATDISNGYVVISVSATPNSPCVSPDDSATTSKTINITAAPVANAGSRFSHCESDGDIVINASTITAENGAILWKIASGSGTLTNETTKSPTYKPSILDYSNGFVSLELQVTGADPCTTVAKSTITIDLYASPSVNAGNDATTCASTNYTISGATVVNANNVSSYSWTILSGPGSILAGTQNTLNATFVPSSTITQTTITLLQIAANPNSPCTSSSTDTIQITTYPAPKANAGTDATICESVSNPLAYTLSNATASSYTSLLWSTSGTGTFNNTNPLNPVYYPSTQDINNGSVQLSITASQDNCSNVTDVMTLYISKDLSVTAGSDATICAGNSYTILDATTSIAGSSYNWVIVTSGVNGTLSNETSLVPTFNSATTDSGVVVLRLTATPPGTVECTSNDVAEVSITVNPAPVVNAGSDKTICEGDNVIITDASATNFQSRLWTTSGDGTFFSSTDLLPTYVPGSNDKITGSVKLTLTVTGNNGCTSVSDVIDVTIIKDPTLNIVPTSINICEDTTSYSIPLNDVVDANVVSYTWTTNTDGTYNDASLRNPTYTFTSNEINAGQVTLKLTANNGNTCNTSVTDSFVINFVKNPTANTGESSTVSFCNDLSYYSISNASATNYSSLVWSSSSSGSNDFSAPTNLVTNYTPNATDIANGYVVITLTAQPKTECNTVATSSFTLNIEPSPVITVPTNQVICETDVYTVQGVTIANSYDASTVQFISSGSGSFASTGNVLAPNYTPSASDIAAGSVNITVSVSPNSSCSTLVEKTFALSFYKQPTVSLNAERIDTCEGNVSLEGYVTIGGNYSSISWSTPDGNGTFNSNNVAEPSYIPNASDYNLTYVTLQVTLIPQSPCANTATDTIKIYFNKQPKILSLSHNTICASDSFNFVYGTNFSVENSAGFIFTSSDGVVTNPTSNNVTIQPNSTAIAKGYADITLEVLPISPCTVSTFETKRVSIQPLPILSTGGDQIVCESDVISTAGTSLLNGELTSVQWTASSGSNAGTFANSTSLVTTYTPSVTDINNGYVDLVVTANGVSPTCAVTVSSSIHVTINKASKITLNHPSTTRQLCEGDIYVVSSTDYTLIENYSQITWSVVSGNGTLSGANTLAPTYASVSSDLLLTNSKVVLKATLTGNTGCSNLASDQIEILIKPIATLTVVDSNVNVCENGQVDLAATYTNAVSSSIKWELVSGFGSLLNATTSNPTFVADPTTSTTVVRVSVTSESPCSTVITKEVTITVSPKNTVSLAKSSDYVCSNETSYNIVGSTAINPTSVLWTTSGSGNFSAENNINPSYTPSAADISAGSVVLTLTGISGAGCDASQNGTASMTLNFQAPPSASFASATDVTCVGDTYNFNDLTTNALTYSAVLWTVTGGNGTLTGANTINPSYSGALNDVGPIVLKGTFSGLNGCSNLEITKTITVIQQVKSIDVGADQTICVGSNVAFTPTITPLNATANSYYSSVVWSSSGDGSWSPNNATLNATYIPGSIDKSGTNSPVIITLQTNPVSSCTVTKTDSMLLSFNNLATVNAGNDVSVCANEQVSLSGTSNASSVYWTSSSGGSFDNPSSLTTKYNFSATDFTLGSVTLSLHAVSDAPCDEVIDSMVVTVNRLPIANAGADRNAQCQGSTVIIDDASISFGTPTWSLAAATGYSLDAGTQLQNASSNQPSVVIGNGQTGSLILTLSVAQQGACTGAAVTDELIINVQPNPSITEVSGGPVAYHCQENSSYSVSNLSVLNYKSLLWTTTGSGSFTDATVSNPVYSPSLADYAAGSVTLHLIAFADGTCTTNAAYDLNITLIQNPVITLSQSTLSSCGTNTVSLSGVSVNSVVVSQNWSTSGSGSFSSQTALNPTYTPSAADLENGQVTLTVAATGNSSCTVYTTSKQITLNLEKQATVNIISPDSVCEGTTISLNASTDTTSAEVTWSILNTNGSQTAFTNTAAKTTSYIPTAADITRGYIEIQVTTVSTANCPSATATKSIQIAGQPTIAFNVSSPLAICSSDSTVSIDATITNESSFNWTHNGAGSFVYLNPSSGDPDIIYTPVTADYGKELTFTLSVNPISPCGSIITKDFKVQFTQAPSANAGSDITICETGSLMTGASVSNNSTFSWTTDGDGIFTTTNALEPTAYTYTPGTTDINSGSVNVHLWASPNAGCSSVVSDTRTLTIDKNLSLTLAADKSFCNISNYTFVSSDMTIVGNYSSGAILWKLIQGSGTLQNPTSLFPTYIPNASDSTVILELNLVSTSSCANAVSDRITLNYTSTPSVNAGSDKNYCSDIGSFTLNEASTSAGLTYLWTTSGDGSFSNNSTLNPIYTPGSSDLSNGSVVLTLKGSASSPCNTFDTSDITITFDKEATLNLPTTLIFCAGETIQLNASGNFTGIVWTHNGNGTLNNATISNPVYTLNASDSFENVVFTAVASLNGSICSNVVKQVSVDVKPALSVASGPDIVLCATDSNVTISGASVIGASTYLWTLPSTSDGTLTNANTLNPTYTPGNNDKANGGVVITLNAANSGSCASNASDNITVSIPQIPTANAGVDKSSCGTSEVVLNDATATPSSNVTYLWTTNGTGSFNGGENTLNPSYFPSSTDVSNGAPITLTLKVSYTSLGCVNEVTDTTVLTLSGAVVVNAGADVAVCGTTVTLDGSVVPSSTSNIIWTTTGGGSFSDETSLKPVYTFSAAEITQGYAVLKLTAYGSGVCSGGSSDDVKVTINQNPVLSIDNSTPFTVCNSLNTVILSGSSTVPAGIKNPVWTHNGTGVFTSGATTLNATYQFTAADKVAGSVLFTLSADGVAPCSNPASVSKLMTFSTPITNTPVISGPTEVCKSDTTTVTYTSSAITSADSYQWTVPTGVEIISGQGSRTLSVKFPATSTSGPITVTALNNCGNSPTASINVTAASLVLGAMNGDDALCQGTSTVTYSVPALSGNASYTWSYSGTGATIVLGNNTNQITVNYNNSATSGIWSVYGTLSCGNTNTVSKSITLNTLPSINTTASNIPATVCSGNFTQQLYFNNTMSSISWSRTTNIGIKTENANGTSALISDELINETSTDISVQYVVVMTDINGCTATENFTVVVKPQLKLTSSLTYNACTGSPIAYTFNNNNSSATYTWSRSLPTGITSNNSTLFSGQITETLTNNTSAPIPVTYTIIETAGSCTNTEQLIVTVVPSPQLSSNTAVTTCEGSFTYEITSSSSLNSISWTGSNGTSGSGTTISDSLTANVSYTITLENTSGCTNSEVVNVTVNLAPTFSLAIGESICSGDTYSFTVTDTTNSYSWSRATISGITETGRTVASNVINEVLTNTTPDPIDVTYEITATKNGCTTIKNHVVRVNPVPVITSSNVVNVCTGEALNYQLTANIPGTTYSWTRNSVTGISNATTSGTSSLINETLINTTTSAKQVTYLVTATSGSCSGSTQAINVTVYPKATFVGANTISTPVVVCSGIAQATTLLSDIPAQLNWTRIAVDGISNIAGSGVNVINETLVNTTNLPVIVTYEVTAVADANNCSSEVAYYYVKVQPSLEFDTTTLNPDTYCSGESISHVISSNLDSNYTVTYTWTRSLPSSISSVEHPQTNYTGSGNIVETLKNNLPYTISVPYVISATVSGSSCALPSKTINIPVYAEPYVTSEKNWVGCSGGTLADYKITSNVPATYTWARVVNPLINGGTTYNGTGNILNETIVSTSNDVVDVVYNITSTAISNGCTSTDSVTVKIYPSVNITSSLTGNICSGGNVDYTITSSVTSTLDMVYTWSRPSVSGISEAPNSGSTNRIFEQLTNSTASPIQVPYTLNASYEFTYNNNGQQTASCRETQILYITVYPSVDISSDLNVDVCDGSEFNYTLTSDTPGTTFTWSVTYPSEITSSNTTTGTNKIEEVFTHGVDYPVTLKFLVTATANGCTPISKTLEVIVQPKPRLLNPSTTFEVCSGDTFNFTPTSNVASTFTWRRPAVSGITNVSTSGTGPISESLINTGTSSKVVTYYYQLTSASNCTLDTEGQILVWVRPSLEITTSNPAAACNVANNVDLAITGSIPGATYQWTRTLPDGISSTNGVTYTSAASTSTTSIQETLSNNTANTINVRYTISGNVNGYCGASKDITVPILPKTTLTSGNATTMCSGESVGYTIATNLAATFTWVRQPNSSISTNNSVTGTGATINDVLINTTSTTTVVQYVIESITVGDLCTDSFTLNVTVPPTLDINSTLTGSVCSSNAFTYQITTAYPNSNTTYNWTRAQVSGILGTSTSGNSANINETLVNTTDEIVQVTYVLNASLNGCVSTKNLVVDVYPTPKVNSQAVLEVCSGSPVNFSFTSLTPSATFSWTANFSSISAASPTDTSGTNTISNTFTNNYSYVVTVPVTVYPISNGCVGQPSNFTIRVLPLPSLTNEPSGAEICSGSTFNFVPAPNIDATFTWSRAIVAGIQNNASNGTGTIVEDLINTTTSSKTVTYNYQLTSTDGCTMLAEGSFTVDVKPAFTIDVLAIQPEICNNVLNNVSITIPSQTGVSYSWTRSLPLGVQSIDHSASNYGESDNTIVEQLNNTSDFTQNVNYKITASLNGGCVTEKTITIPVLPSPKITSSLNVDICTGNSVNYTIVSNNATSYSWTASTTNNFISGGSVNSSGGSINDVLTNTSTQTQEIYYKIYPIINGCQETTPTLLKVTVRPTTTFSYSTLDEICSGNTVPLDISLLSPLGTTFTWSRPSIVGIAEAPSSGTHLNINVDRLTNTSNSPITVPYTLNTSYANCEAMFTYQVIVNPSPSISSATEIELCSGESVNYTIITDAVSVTWERIDNTAIRANSKTISSSLPTNLSGVDKVYYYKLYLYNNSKGCDGVSQLKVTVHPDPVINSDTQSSTVCSGSVFNYLPTSNVSGAVVSWTRNADSAIIEPSSNGTGVINEALTIASGVTGNVSVTYNITFTKNSCSTTTTKIVNVLAPPSSMSLNVTTNSVADSNNPYDISSSYTICSNNVISILPVAIDGYTFNRWTRAEVLGIDNQANSGFGPAAIQETLKNNSEATVEVTYTIYMSSSNGCELPFNFKVLVQPDISLSLDSAADTEFQKVCSGVNISPINYKVIGDMANYSLVWKKKNGSNWEAVTLSDMTVVNNSGNLIISGTNSTPGLYKYTLTANGSCTDTNGTPITTFKEGTVEILEKPLIEISQSSVGVANQNICVGTAIDPISFTITNLSTGSVVVENLPPSLGYSLSGNVLIIQGTPSDVQASGSNLYTIKTTGACEALFEGNLIVSPLPSASLTSDISTKSQSVCSGSPITPITYSVLNATGATVVWSPNVPAGIVANYSGGALTISGTPNITSATNSFSFSIELTGGSCTASKTTITGGSISIIPKIEVDLEVVLADPETNLESCVASLRSIDISSGLKNIPNSNNLIIEWSGPGGYSNNTKFISNLEAGTYTLNVYDKTLGCATGPIAFEVKEISPLVIEATITPVGCNGENGNISLDITGEISGNLDIKWTSSTSSVVIGTGYILNAPEGVYTVSVKDQGADCPASTRIYEITKGNVGFTLLEQNNVQCFDAADGSFLFTIDSQNSIASYTLMNANTQTQITNANIEITSGGVFIQGLSPGDYYVGALDSGGCYYAFNDASQIIKITQPIGATEALAINSNDVVLTDSSCGGLNNGSIILSKAVVGGVSFVGTNPYIVNWVGLSSTNSNFRQNVLDIDKLAPGEYQVTIEDKVGCSLIANYIIEESNTIAVSSNITHISCNNNSGSVDFDISGGQPPYNFKLYIIDPTSSQRVDVGARDNITNFYNLRNLEAGNYILEVTDQGINCVKEVPFEIKDLSDIQIESVDLSEEICNGNPGYIYVTIYTNTPSSILFYYNDVAVNTDNVSALENNKFELYIQNPSSPFTVKAANGSGCFSQEYFVNNQLQIAPVTITSNSFEDFGEYRTNDPILFTTSYDFYTIPSSYDFVSWDFGDFSYKQFSFETDVTPNANNEFVNQVYHEYTANGVYDVTYRLYNIYGCYQESTFTIRVGSGYEIIIPTAFTPNDDGINDYFRPVLSGFTDVSILMFDGLGNKVFEYNNTTDNLDATWGWNGIESAERMPKSGSYKYLINATTIDGDVITRTGEVFLIH